MGGRMMKKEIVCSLEKEARQDSFKRIIRFIEEW